MRRSGHYFLIAVAALTFVFMPCLANADNGGPQPLSCDNAGGVAGGQLFYADQANNLGVCQFQNPQGAGQANEQVSKHVFSQIVCSFASILDEVLDEVYCGIQYALQDTLRILLTLYVAIFGAQLLLGTAQLSARDILIRLLKIAAVWTFATESTAGIGMVFSFFMSIMTDLSAWVIDTLVDAQGNVIGGIQDAQGNISGGIQFADVQPGDPGNMMVLFGFFDALIFTAFSGPIGAANTKVLGFFMAMIFINPMMTGLFLWWVKTTFMTLARTVLSFLVCMAAVAFLVTLSPIFLSFMLFQFTMHFFDNWIRHMAAYSLQVVLIFGVIVLWIIAVTSFISFFTELSNVIFIDQPTVMNAIYTPENTSGICPFTITTDASGAPSATCAASFGPVIQVLLSGPALTMSQKQQLIPPSEIDNYPDFLYYMFYHLASLIIMTYAFSTLLQYAPQIATSIAGSAPIPQLLGGWGSGTGPGLFEKAVDMFKAPPAPAAGAGAGTVAGAVAGAAAETGGRFTPGTNVAANIGFTGAAGAPSPDANRATPARVAMNQNALRKLITEGKIRSDSHIEGLLSADANDPQLTQEKLTELNAALKGVLSQYS